MSTRKMAQLLTIVIFSLPTSLSSSSILAYGQLPVDPVRQVSWSPDGNYLALSVGEAQIEVLDVNQNIIGQFPLGDVDDAVNPVWSPLSSAVAFEVGNLFVDQRLVIWYFLSGNWIEIGEDILFGGLTELDPVWNDDGTRIAVIRGRTLHIVDALTGQVVYQTPYGTTNDSYSIINIEWSPDGNRLLTEDSRGIISLLNGETYVVESTFLGQGQNQIYNDIIWTTDPQHFAAVNPDAIYIYDSLTQQVVRTYLNPPGALLQWSGTVMVFAVGLDTLQFVNAQSFQVLDTVLLNSQGEAVYSASWDPISNRVAYTLRSLDLTPLPANMDTLYLQDLTP